jgi:hypothetical protein
VLMDVHKDCYSAINLTQQGGPYRRETGEKGYCEGLNAAYLDAQRP